MDVLQPSFEQVPLFGGSSSGGSSMFMEWQQSSYTFLQIAGKIIGTIFSEESWDIAKAILTLVSMFSITVIIYCLIRMLEIRKKEHHHLEHEIAEYAHNRSERERERRRVQELSSNPRWVNIINYLAASDSAQWKMAIMEADGMMENLLDQLGFRGETMGDKLKSVDPKKFRNLPAAWEAHAVRNRVAHEGSTFVLTSREAKRIISLYEQIFREFGFI